MKRRYDLSAQFPCGVSAAGDANGGTSGHENMVPGKVKEACRNVLNKREEKTGSIIETAKNYIKNNYHKDISLDDVSREVNISPYYFSKLFKETTGENFIEYLTNLRMDKAKELLQTTECSMKEICVKTGYSDPNYFSRSFKKNVGVTPTEYKENRGKGQEQGSV